MPELPNLVGHDQQFSMNGLISYVSFGGKGVGGLIEVHHIRLFILSVSASPLKFPPTHAIMLSYVLYGVLCTLCCLQTVPRILNLYEDITSLPNKEHVAKCRSVI